MAHTKTAPKRDVLQSSEILRALPEAELDALAGRVRRSRYGKGEIIFTKADEGSGVMIVVSGRVKIVSVAPSGAEVIHNIIEPRQVFGEMAMLDGKPRSGDAIAVIDTEIVEVSRRDFLDVLKRNPDVAIEMMSILCGRIRQSTSFVEDAVLLDAGSRLLHRLVDLADQHGRLESDGRTIRVEHGLSQQEIGESVGLTRVSINRLLSEWRRLGLIADGRGFVVLKDLDALQERVRATQSGSH